MTMISTIKQRIAGALLRLSTSLQSLPASTQARPTVAAEGEPPLQWLAMRATAWMAYASQEERMAAAALLRRHHPDIGPHIEDAVKLASDFTNYLRALVAKEEAALAAAEGSATDADKVSV